MKFIVQDIHFYCTKEVPENHNHFCHSGETHFLVHGQTLIYASLTKMSSENDGRFNVLDCSEIIKNLNRFCIHCCCINYGNIHVLLAHFKSLNGLLFARFFIIFEATSKIWSSSYTQINPSYSKASSQQWRKTETRCRQDDTICV